MKKLILAIYLSIGCGLLQAQPNCTNPHRIFTVPKDKTPTIVKQLGTDPQFPIMCNLDNADMFYKNLRSLAEIQQFKNEINNLFMAIGYTEGVKDPRFTRDKVWAEPLPFGAIGMLGDARHNYKYSLLALPGQTTIKAWHIKALSGCDLYFMSRCGNAFYYTNPPITRETIAWKEHCTGTAKLKLKVVARYDGREYCTCNDCANSSFVKGDVEKAVLAVDKISNIPLTQDGDEYPEKTIYIDVNKHTFKRIRDYDLYGKYDKHRCDNNCCADGCDHGYCVADK